MKHLSKEYTPLKSETRSVIDTDCAAHHLNRKPQTLRWWASCGRGPVKPLRIEGRLAWSVDHLRKVLTPADG